MFLYRIGFNNLFKSRLLADPNFMHGFTMLAVDGYREEANLLWYLDRRTHNLYIQTDRLVETAKWSEHPDVKVVEGPMVLESLLLPRLTRGTTVTYRVLASPMRRRDGKERKLDKAEEQEQWLREKFAGALNVIDSRCTEQPTLVSKRRSLSFKRVLFEGLASVEDVEKLRDLIQHGVGRGKNFGFGLLQVVPA